MVLVGVWWWWGGMGWVVAPVRTPGVTLGTPTPGAPPRRRRHLGVQMQRHQANLLNYNLFIRTAPIFPRCALRCAAAPPPRGRRRGMGAATETS